MASNDDLCASNADLLAPATYYRDADNDGAGDAANTTRRAVAVGVGAVGVAADRVNLGDDRDVGALFSGYGNSHGFWASLAAPTTPVQVCVYAVEAAGSGGNQLLGCRTV